MKTEKKRTLLTVEITPNLYALLTLHANACGVKRSDIVRWALTEYVDKFAGAINSAHNMKEAINNVSHS